MIRISIHEAAAFDMLAIQEVKWRNKVIAYADVLDTRGEIVACLGDRWVDRVTDSREYSILLGANSIVFDLVALAATDACRASDVDAANQRRYAAKRALQERFWPSNPLTEVKAQRPTRLPTEPITPTVPLNGGA
jgi:hypothetical protein